MKSKAPLVMMEQIVMILVFALAAALCLQAFVLSDASSRRAAARDRAAAVAQTVAETIRHTGGDAGTALSGAAKDLGMDYEQGLLWADFDEDWNRTPSGEEGAYRVAAQGTDSGQTGLQTARVEVSRSAAEAEEADVLLTFDVSWQGEAG